MAQECALVFYCDMHGHSKSKDAFIYGNTDSLCPDQYKVFPFVLSQLCPAFSFPASCFAVERDKLATARVTVWREFETCNVFTLESSFFGPQHIGRAKQQLETSDYQEIGRRLCLAVHVCHALGLSSFLQAGRVGAALFDGAVSSTCSKDETVCGVHLRKLRKRLEKAKQISLEDPALSNPEEPADPTDRGSEVFLVTDTGTTNNTTGAGAGSRVPVSSKKVRSQKNRTRSRCATALITYEGEC